MANYLFKNACLLQTLYQRFPLTGLQLQKAPQRSFYSHLAFRFSYLNVNRKKNIRNSVQRCRQFIIVHTYVINIVKSRTFTPLSLHAQEEAWFLTNPTRDSVKEDKASWVGFFQRLRGRGLDGVKLLVGDKCMGMLEAVGEVFPDAKYQRCIVHFYRNIFSVVPRSKVKMVAKMLKAIHAQESKKASREKARAVVADLRAMKLKEAAKKVEDGIEETLTCCDCPSEHWTRIRTNNVIERLNREIRRRTRVVGTFPDGNSALMLVCARLRHVAGTQWGNKKYMNMKHLEEALNDVPIAG